MLTKFSYSCVDAAGHESKGVIATADMKEAFAKLKERGLTVLELREKRTAQKKSFSLKKGFGDQDVYNLSRELSILLRSGIRIDHGIELLMNSATRQEPKDILSRVLGDIKAGKGVAQAFQMTKRFGPLFVTMIQVGEAMGNLQTALENIAQYYKFQMQFKGEIRNAMTYPLFLICASIIILVVIFNFIIPRFFSIFGTDLKSLPMTARILHTVSSYLSFSHVALVAGILVAAIVLWKRSNPEKANARTLYTYLLHVPVVGRLILNLELSRFCYAMYSMLQSGIEFIKALKLSATLIQNANIRGPIESLVEQIKGGKKIAEAFAQVHFLPEIVPNMLRVGEGSGNLKELFFELHQIFDERFKNTTKRVLVLVEPSIIVIMGLIVGFIVISLILTVMSVGNIKL